MTALLLSQAVAAQQRDRLERIVRESGTPIEQIVLPAGSEDRLDDATAARVEAAFFSPDLFPDHSAKFFSAVFKAPRLRWVHIFNTGTDHPVFAALRERGAALTNFPEAQGHYIAQTAAAGLLMLARGFTHWLHAQRRHEWSPIPRGEMPADLEAQTLVIVGMGAIGAELARLIRPFGLRIVGVRRHPSPAREPFDEIHSVEALDTLLPRADWLVVACPLDERTRGLLDRRRLGLLPAGARVLNVARGEIVDQTALEEGLRSGHLAAAYLDVFETEPLPADSGLWDLPNCVLSPHNSAAASGVARRQVEGFLQNLERWARKEPLRHVVG